MKNKINIGLLLLFALFLCWINGCAFAPLLDTEPDPKIVTIDGRMYIEK